MQINIAFFCENGTFTCSRDTLNGSYPGKIDVLFSWLAVLLGKTLKNHQKSHSGTPKMEKMASRGCRWIPRGVPMGSKALPGLSEGAPDELPEASWAPLGVPIYHLGSSFALKNMNLDSKLVKNHAQNTVEHEKSIRKSIYRNHWKTLVFLWFFKVFCILEVAFLSFWG